MLQSAALVDTIKRQLKARGFTYADVAEALSLSEASVKRLFAQRNFTLDRLDRLCEILELDFMGLARLMEVVEPRISGLTLAQEQEIANDDLLLLVVVCVLNGYAFGDILAQYQLTEHQLIRKLAQLDRLAILELQPGNRIRLKVSRDFTWLPGGPIQRLFLDKVAKDFFQSTFTQDTEALVVANGLLSPANNLLFQDKMQRLIQEFNHIAKIDQGLTMSEKFGTTVVVALRQWRFSLFDQLTR